MFSKKKSELKQWKLHSFFSSFFSSFCSSNFFSAIAFSLFALQITHPIANSSPIMLYKLITTASLKLQIQNKSKPFRACRILRGHDSGPGQSLILAHDQFVLQSLKCVNCPAISWQGSQ
jgi:hypothetical protein